uniref:Putative secreted protein n=1 Tax=Ixodes ricinus TaxID=34613 RepID=A0A6B0UUI9_IXORI
METSKGRLRWATAFRFSIPVKYLLHTLGFAVGVDAVPSSLPVWTHKSHPGRAVLRLVRLRRDDAVLRAVRDLARTVAVDHSAIVAAFLVRNSHLRNYSANPPQCTTNAAADRSSPVQLTRLPLGAPWSGLELDPHGSYRVVCLKFV